MTPKQRLEVNAPETPSKHHPTTWEIQDHHPLGLRGINIPATTNLPELSESRQPQQISSNTYKYTPYFSPGHTAQNIAKYFKEKLFKGEIDERIWN